MSDKYILDVADDHVGDVRVSTVFLGHSFGGARPLLFETMIFGGAHDGARWRYSTWDEAEAGHAAALRRATDVGVGMNMTDISPVERANAAVNRAELRNNAGTTAREVLRDVALADVRELREIIVQQARRIAELEKQVSGDTLKEE